MTSTPDDTQAHPASEGPGDGAPTQPAGVPAEVDPARGPVGAGDLGADTGDLGDPGAR